MKNISLEKLREVVDWCSENKEATQFLEYRDIHLGSLDEELVKDLNLELIGGSYQILDKITYSASDNDVFAIVVGKSLYESSPQPYGTWLQNSRGYDLGHYFTEKVDAINDFKERSATLLGINSDSINQNKEYAQGVKEFRIINGGSFARVETREDSQSEWVMNCYCGNLNTSKNPAITLSILENIANLNKQGYRLSDVDEYTKEIDKEKNAERDDLEMEI